MPLVVSNYDFDFVMDLLLLSDGQKYHYVLIHDLCKLVDVIRNRGQRNRNQICRNCFHVFNSYEALETHREVCGEKSAVVVSMPTNTNDSVAFKRYEARWFAPFVLYYDFESLIVPLDTTFDDPNKSSTTTLERHQPCGYSLALVEHGKTRVKLFEIKRGPDVMQHFIKKIECLANQIHDMKRANMVFSEHPPLNKANVDQCWICEDVFGENEVKVIDHCHVSGQFLGFAHSMCNVRRKTVNFTPVIAHNASNYDLHHIMRALVHSDSRNTFSVIPSTDEKFLSLTIGVWIKSVFDEKTKQQRNVFEYMRFIDSFNFMNSSLASLAENLPVERFTLLDNFFRDNRNFTDKQISLLKQKGYYPYSYITNFSKFEERLLPPLRLWKNSLANGKVEISRAEYNHAKKVFAECGCRNIGQYHDLYLCSDTLILACVFETFRTVCYATYGLDCAFHYTASHLAGDAFLKTCKSDLKLLTVREHLDMTEKMIRGGMSSVYAHRFWKANNKFLPEYDPTQTSTFILNIDANNLYGGIMEHYRLPLNDFQLVDKEINDILLTDDDDEYGFIVEVDLEIPEELHEYLSDFPPAPTKEVIDVGQLGEFQQNVLERLNVKTVGGTKKLVQTLSNKERYVVHYSTLKLYVRLGLRVRKLHRTLQFRQTKWLAPYVKLNSERRQSAQNKFEENFFKLMSNSAYGKTMESKRNRRNVTVVRNYKDMQREANKFQLRAFNIIDEEFATTSAAVTKITWDKPTIVGAVILDLSKKFMFDFHYMKMKACLNLELLYGDTDSFIYKIESEDLYEELAKNKYLKSHFDFSNYSADHPLYSQENQRVVLKFKDEMKGKIVSEFVGLKPKLYSLQAKGYFPYKIEKIQVSLMFHFLVLDETQKLSAKGITKYGQRELVHRAFRAAPSSDERMRVRNTTIVSKNHSLSTVVVNKVALCNLDLKRYILDNGIETKPFGHKLVRFNHLPEFQLMSDWEESEPSLVCIPSTPDPGFMQREYSSEELNDVVDFDIEFDEAARPDNPFILHEAEESAGEHSTPEVVAKRKRRAVIIDDSE